MSADDGAERIWPPVDYSVGRENIRQFVEASGERRVIYRDPKVSGEAGFRDVVAPPMFAAVYCWRSVRPALADAGIDMTRILHTSQEFVWSEPVCAGDTITTVAELRDRAGSKKASTYVLGTVSHNQEGDEVSRGTWTILVKGG